MARRRERGVLSTRYTSAVLVECARVVCGVVPLMSEVLCGALYVNCVAV